MTDDQLAEAHRAIMAGERCAADVYAELTGDERRRVELAVNISTAYQQLADRPGDLVSLAQLRDALPGVDRADLDATLLAMDRQRRIQLDPDPDRRNLTQRAKDAAIWLGGEYMHLITINAPGG